MHKKQLDVSTPIEQEMPLSSHLSEHAYTILCSSRYFQISNTLPDLCLKCLLLHINALITCTSGMVACRKLSRAKRFASLHATFSRQLILLCHIFTSKFSSSGAEKMQDNLAALSLVFIQGVFDMIP